MVADAQGLIGKGGDAMAVAGELQTGSIGGVRQHQVIALGGGMLLEQGNGIGNGLRPIQHVTSRLLIEFVDQKPRRF